MSLCSHSCLLTKYGTFQLNDSRPVDSRVDGSKEYDGSGAPAVERMEGRMVMIEKTRTRRIGKRAVKVLPSPSAACRGRRGPA